MVLNVHRNHQDYSQEKRGKLGVIRGGGKREIISNYAYRYTVTTRKGSDESHFNVSFSNCEGQSHKTVSTDHNF